MILRLAPVLALVLALASGVVAQTRSTESRREAFLVPMPGEAGWPDLAYLAAIPAAARATGGLPVALALGPDGALTPEVEAFLRRYRPERLSWIGTGPADGQVAGFASRLVAARSADEAACALADVVFGECAHVVVVDAADYPAALNAAVLAARLAVPLYFSDGAGLSSAARASIERRAARRILVVGERAGAVSAVAKSALERLRAPADIARWMARHELPIDYVAAVAPADRVVGRVRKMSLAGALLAAGRAGIVAPVGAEGKAPANAASVREELARFRAQSGTSAEYLCLAAMPEAIPMEAIPSGEGIDSDPPSDIAYANVDADPFLELACGRFVAESCAAGTLLAARSLAYNALLDPSFSGRFALAEWERLAAPALEDAGFAPPFLHVGGQPIDQQSPLASVAVLIHGAHSSWTQLGQTYAHDSAVLLAPCVVESSGCSPASLDQDPEHRSVALRLLRNGAVAFVGNSRRGVAQQELQRTEFWNAVLAGASLGRAHQNALNRVLVAVLANGEDAGGLRRYQLYNATFFGDPALALHLPRRGATRPAGIEVTGRDCVVRAPATWWRTEQFVPEDWKYTASPKLFGWRGSGVGVESSWDAANKRNRDELIYTAEVRTKRRVSGLAAVRSPGDPLGWDGRWFVDEHADGTRSVYFRVRMLDGDPATGEIRSRFESARFRLE